MDLQVPTQRAEKRTDIIMQHPETSFTSNLLLMRRVSSVVERVAKRKFLRQDGVCSTVGEVYTATLNGKIVLVKGGVFPRQKFRICEEYVNVIVENVCKPKFAIPHNQPCEQISRDITSVHQRSAVTREMDFTITCFVRKTHVVYIFFSP